MMRARWLFAALLLLPGTLVARPEHEMASAPKPDVNFPEYAASRDQMVRVLHQRFFAGALPEFGQFLAQNLWRSQVDAAGRLGWLHQSLVLASAALTPSFIPVGRGSEINNAADYALNFLAACRQAGFAAWLAVPYDPDSLRLAGLPGVLVRLDGTAGERWYFPASRVFPAGRVPWYLERTACLVIAADGTFREVRLQADLGGTSWTRIDATVRRDGRQQLQIRQTTTGLDAAIARAGEALSGSEPVSRRLFRGKDVSFWSVRQLWQLGEPFSCEGALSASQDADFATELLDIRLKKRFDGYRPGDWQDEIRYVLPVGTRVRELPRPLARVKSGVRATARWRLARGPVLVRPAHWSQPVWQRWLAGHDPRTPDTLIRERRLTRPAGAPSSAVRDAVDDALDDLADYPMPDVVLPSGGR